VSVKRFAPRHRRFANRNDHPCATPRRSSRDEGEARSRAIGGSQFPPRKSERRRVAPEKRADFDLESGKKNETEQRTIDA
jgi:hypothetical protein